MQSTRAWCPHRGVDLRYAIRGHEYVRCRHCGVVRLNPLPDDATATAYYTEEYFTGGLPDAYASYAADEAIHRLNAIARWKQIEKEIERGRLLDVGCALGYALDEARRRGWSVCGVEPSRFARDVAVSRFGLDVRAHVPAFSDGERFDVVALCQVLEHSAVPDELLLQVSTILEPGGIVFIETWDIGSLWARLAGRHWLQLAPPSVLWAFNRASLGDLLAATGFTLRWVRRTTKVISLGHLLILLGERYPRLLGPLCRRLGRIRGLTRRSFRYGLGDLITAVAVRS